MTNRLEAPLLYTSASDEAQALNKYLLINNKCVDEKFWLLPVKNQAPSYICWLYLS